MFSEVVTWLVIFRVAHNLKAQENPQKLRQENLKLTPNLSEFGRFLSFNPAFHNHEHYKHNHEHNKLQQYLTRNIEIDPNNINTTRQHQYNNR